MRIRLASPMKRSGSSKAYFEKRIPSDLVDRMDGLKFIVPLSEDRHDDVLVTLKPGMRSIRFSLRTSHPSEIKKRQAAALSYFEDRFEEVRNSRPLTLTHRQATALAGKLYEGWAAGPDKVRTMVLEGERGNWKVSYRLDEAEDEELTREAAAAFRDRQGTDEAKRDLEGLSRIVDGLLLKDGFPLVSEETKTLVVPMFYRALVEGLEAGAKRAGGDYSPDPVASRFPKWERPQQDEEPRHKGPSAEVSLTGLVEGWWKEARASGLTLSTYEGYQATFRRLSLFLGHDDASRVTPEDIVKYKDHRLATPDARTGRPITPKTFRGIDLSGMRSVFDWAVANLKISANPAKGVTVKAARQIKLRERDFTIEEGTALLKAANEVLSGVSKPNRTQLACRWVPWLCAYSGARVGELVQLRKEDIRYDHGTSSWVMTITPEAGTVKGKEAREIPLHPHLLEMGFGKFVDATRDGFLFMDIKPGATARGVWRSKKNRLAEFARKIVTDPNVAPNHGWRHTFKTRGFEADIQEKVLDAICGHAPVTVGRAYGSVSLQTKVDAMKAFPNYTVS